MEDQQTIETAELANKIARLVEERGWNQDEFARNADLNRHTVRQILLQGERRLRNATIGACARALGLSVHDLRNLPLEQLLPRMRAAATVAATNGTTDTRQRLWELATQPELIEWIERNPERARTLNPEEIDELLSLQGTGGPLTAFGVGAFVDRIERRRKIIHQVNAVAGTDYLDLLEQFVGLLYEKVQPYRDRR